MRNKKAIGPVVSTVLLVMIVLVLAAIILLWSRGFIQEIITKQIGEESKRVEQFCTEIQVDTIINPDGTFGFTNTGNVPIYSLNVKLSNKGASEFKEIEAESGGSVNPGFATMVKDSATGEYIIADNYEEVRIIPILLGRTKSGGPRPVQCDDSDGFLI